MTEYLNGINDIRKIDSAPALGLTGAVDSVAYRAAEIDRHSHHYTRVFGLAAAPAGETHRADEITTDPEPFEIDAGNDTWGAWVQVFGTTDTPSGWIYFDPAEINIVSAETANVVYLIQMAAGVSGAAGLSAGTYSDRVFTPQSANGRPAALLFGLRRRPAGTALWMRTLCRGTNTSKLGIYLDMHGYEG